MSAPHRTATLLDTFRAHLLGCHPRSSSNRMYVDGAQVFGASVRRNGVGKIRRVVLARRSPKARMSTVDGHPYKVEVGGSNPSVPTRQGRH